MRNPVPKSKILRCAVYTRKSSEEGLEQDFNSLHAQRESCEAYIKSQKHEGWTALSAVYDDGGYSGGSMDRPALKRLLADIQSKSVDVVVLNCWVTETNETPAASKTSTILAKSASDRVRRSTL